MTPENGTSESEKRPWFAALLSILFPGLGHAYLRAWARALVWVLLLTAATVVMIPPEIAPASFTVEAFMDAYAQIPTYVSLAVFALTVLCALDAYRMAQAQNRRVVTPPTDEVDIPGPETGGDVGTCPNCGKELDEDLDFCPWCSFELGSEDADE